MLTDMPGCSYVQQRKLAVIMIELAAGCHFHPSACPGRLHVQLHRLSGTDRRCLDVPSAAIVGAGRIPASQKDY